MMTTRIKFIAEYLYPGTFVPETASREIDVPTQSAAEAAMPDGNVGYTSTCYGIRLFEQTERLWESDGEFQWLPEGERTIVDSWAYGKEVHYDDIPDTPNNEILRSNVRINTKDGYAVKHISGNWTFRRDWNRVVSPRQS